MSCFELDNSNKIQTEATEEEYEEVPINNKNTQNNISSELLSAVSAQENDKEEPKYFNGVEISKLTKRQKKKYLKTLKWEARKKEKRANERLKAKKRKMEAKLNNIDLGPSRKQLKRSTMANSPCKIGVVIDLSFDHLMISKVLTYSVFFSDFKLFLIQDMGKVIKQILRIYTENRRAKAPMQLYLTNFEGRAKEEMAKHNGYENWDINFRAESYLKLFPKDKLVYLTSESNKVITELQEDKVYIIGGLVDHNSHKGICYKKAVDEGIDHGQLPIREYFHTKHRKVFTINQGLKIWQ